ncbi:alpha-D-ribose 1-methylphosphonate 5-triphosphate diphosphatase [Nocardia sp. NPDC004711]
MTPIALHAARLYTATGADDGHPGYVTIDADTIIAVGKDPAPGAQVIELGDVDVIPGLVDLHSDCWDQKAHPRPTYGFPLTDALVVLDAEAAAWGITTHFACVIMQDDILKWRSLEQALDAVEAIRTLKAQLRVDHRIHLRFDLTTEYLDTARKLAETGDIHLLSYLDYTPGQASFKEQDDWKQSMSYAGAQNLDEALVKRQAAQPYVAAVREELAELAREHDIAFASHDDDSPRAVQLANALGARIVEFPVTKDAAEAARTHGLSTVMGAPNLLRGASQTSGNLSARQALESGLLDIVASDYYPPALLRSIYRVAEEGVVSKSDAIRLATANPAAAANLTDRGTLEPGKRADLVVVRQLNGQPVVTQTWVQGQPAFGARS